MLIEHGASFVHSNLPTLRPQGRRGDGRKCLHQYDSAVGLMQLFSTRRIRTAISKHFLCKRQQIGVRECTRIRNSPDGRILRSVHFYDVVEVSGVVMGSTVNENCSLDVIPYDRVRAWARRALLNCHRVQITTQNLFTVGF